MLPVPSLPCSSGRPEPYKVHGVLFANPRTYIQRVQIRAPRPVHTSLANPRTPSKNRQGSDIWLEIKGSSGWSQ